MKYFVGVDLGGTNIKTGVVDENGLILSESSRPTGLPKPAQAVCEDILATIYSALDKAGMSLADIEGVGVGCPGTVDPETGVVVYSNNLAWRDVPLGQSLRHVLQRPVYAGNDANVAALGEVRAGSAMGANSAVIVTLGTGFGAGIVIGSRIWTGHNSAASEFGHMVIVHGGVQCTCGRYGCLESYASATGLIRMTREAMAAHPDSLMNTMTGPEGVDGRTAFEARRQGDTVAAVVVEQYISYLACGITNILNALQPEIISLGGGVAKEGDTLLLPLREKVYSEVFGGCGEKHTRIEFCTLGYRAGIIGAAMLADQT